MDYSDYITWKSKLSQYTGGICPADCTSNLSSGGTGSLPAGRYFSDYLFYNNITSSWQVGSDSVHLGAKAGALGIGNSSIAIGESANARNNYSIAIGKSTNLGGTNTIALNATGSTFATDQNNSFFVSPVRPARSINVLYYDPFSKEVTYGSVPVDAGSGLPSGASKHGEYLYFNGLTWLIGSDKVSIGAGAGATLQMAGAIAIGSNAGNFQQSIGAISIGIDAGKSNQGQNAVAIGSKAGTTSQHPNTVIINATGVDVNSEGVGRLYVKPVREAGGVKSLYYDVSSGEVTYDEPYDGSNIDDASEWAIFRAKQTVDMSGFRMTRLADPVADTDAVNKAYLLAQLRDASDALPLGGGTMLGDIDMSGRRLLRVGDAIASGHAVNKGYVDGGFLKLQGGIMTGNIDMSGYMLRVASDPSGATDVVNKRYLLAQLRDVSDALPLGGGTMLGDIDMSGKRLLRIAEPLNDGDVTTKNYVDTRIPLGKTYGEYIYHDGVKWAIGGTSVNLGLNAGVSENGDDTVAIGNEAGRYGQGDFSVAIGALAGQTNQADKSIVINATGVAVNADISNAFYVKPVREKAATKALYYDVSSGEISYSDISGGVGEANGGLIGTNTLYNNQYKFRRYPYGLNINDGKTVADPLNQVTEQDTIANAFAKVDDWIHSYLIAQPPVPIQLELLKKATPTSIYLAFQNPIQIKSAVFKKKLPLIEQVNVDICNNNTPYKAFTLDTQYIPDISGITAFVISKVPVIPPYRTINLTISGESNSKEFNAYYYYNNGIAGSTATSNLVKLWYSNFSELPPNVLTALLPGFAAGSAPSVSRDLSLNAITKQTFFANWNPPIFSDLINGIQSIDFDSPLLSYILKYKGVNAVRYGGVLNTTEFTSASLTNSELNLPFSGAIVHPGTKYNVSVFAYNNTISTPSPELSGSLITLYPTAPPSFSTKDISFSTNYLYTPGTDVIAKVMDNSGITYPVLKDYVNASSSTITNIALHKYSGVFDTDKLINTGNNIMKLYGKYHNDLYGDMSFNEYTFNGFGGLLPSSIGNTTDVQLAYNNLGDYYGAGNNENNGFYLTTDAYVQIKPKSISVKNLVASTQHYYINLYQKQNNDTEVFLRSNFFYLDDISSVPIINKCELQYNSSNFIKISGLNVLNTPININTVTDISNIASYYYVKTKLINYKLYNDDNNSLLTNIDLSDIANGKSNYSVMTTMKDYPFKFDKVELNMNYNNVFSKRIRLEIKARNLIGTSSDYKLYKNILIDTESVRNIVLYNMTDVPTLDYVSKSGRLNKTDVNGVIDFDEFSNFRAKYDLSESLLNNTTLQIFNGKFSTKSVSNNAYLDYSELNIDFNNGINYSGISSTGYRYATFAWKVTNFSPAYSGRIVFSIKNIGGSVHMPTIDTQNGVTLNGVPLLFYYRVENINNPTVLERNKTTVWINANRVSSGSLMGDSDKNTDLEFNLALGGRYQSNANNSIYVENNDLIYDVLLFNYLNSSIQTNTHVYATIGIPMIASFSFKNIEAYLIQ
jgi:hypothetical protein